MKYVYRALVLAFIFVGIPRALWLMQDDYENPQQRWNDINHSFPLEAALLGVFVVSVVGLLLRKVRKDKQRQLASRNGATHA